MNRRCKAAILVASIVPLAGGVGSTAPRVAAGAAMMVMRPAAPCAGLPWTFQIGPRVMPLSGARGGRAAIVVATQTARAGRPTSGIVTVWPGYVLRGAITIDAYAGCGATAATSGSFAVRRVLYGPPIARPQKGAGSIPCVDSCYSGMAGIVSATGTFSQDARHAGDPLYVLVTATITSTRPGPEMGRPCSPSAGCPAASTVRSTVHVNDVTGYLQVASGDQSATLSFLPPPGVYVTAPSIALVLQGWRAGAALTPAP